MTYREYTLPEASKMFHRKMQKRPEIWDYNLRDTTINAYTWTINDDVQAVNKFQ